MKKIFLLFFVFLVAWPLVSAAAPTGLTPASLPSWEGKLPLFV